MNSAAPVDTGFLRRALDWWHRLGSWDVELDNTAAIEAEAIAVDSRRHALEDLRQTRMTYDMREPATRSTMPTVGDLKSRLKSDHQQMQEAFGAQTTPKD